MMARPDSYGAQDLLRHADTAFFAIQLYDVQLLLVATVILVAVIVPRLTTNRF